jgi:Ner family transcriptional regulator
MSTAYTAKKSRSRTISDRDMHPADVIAAVRKAGSTIRRLSIEHGYHPCTLKKCLYQQWPGAEAIIASFLGRHPSSIWPSRYDAEGTSTRKPSLRGQWRRASRSNDSAAAAGHHVNVPEGA